MGERGGVLLCFEAWISSLIWLTARLDVHCCAGEETKGWGGMGDVRELLPLVLLLTAISVRPKFENYYGSEFVLKELDGV